MAWVIHGWVVELFCSRGQHLLSARCLRLCVEHFTHARRDGRALRESEVGIVLHSRHWELHGDADLLALEESGVVAWTPPGRDDDVFLLASAAEHDCWVVTNDNWEDHGRAGRRHLTEAVRRRVIKFAWVQEAFVPDPDAMARFNRELSECGA